jgi:NAD(P)-dependent dehydrogenase (short-subunit alcohol dehydrogenase family)
VDLAGRKCLVTGAAGGIGRATALAVAGKGGSVAITDIQEEPLRETARMIEQRGGKVLHTAALDITYRDAVAAMAREIHDAHGSVDVVMNVAGVSTWGPVQRLQEEHWRRMIEINLMGPIHVISEFIPPMIDARRGGHLVNVASAAGLLGLPWHAAYSASKFGLRGVSEVLRFDLRRYRIGVTLVCPGGVDTPLVNTMEIVGVDRTAPVMQKMNAQFRRRAHSPEHVAEKIVRGVEREKYLVYTSNDIRAAHALQKFCPPAYEAIMGLLNKQLVAMAKKAPAETPHG